MRHAGNAGARRERACGGATGRSGASAPTACSRCCSASRSCCSCSRPSSARARRSSGRRTCSSMCSTIRRSSIPTGTRKPEDLADGGLPGAGARRAARSVSRTWKAARDTRELDAPRQQRRRRSICASACMKRSGSSSARREQLWVLASDDVDHAAEGQASAAHGGEEGGALSDQQLALDRRAASSSDALELRFNRDVLHQRRFARAGAGGRVAAR